MTWNSGYGLLVRGFIATVILGFIAYGSLGEGQLLRGAALVLGVVTLAYTANHAWALVRSHRDTGGEALH